MSSYQFREALAAILLAAPALIYGQQLSGAPSVPSAPNAPSLSGIARRVELQTATLNLRYRFIDTTTGTITTNRVQHRECLRASAIPLTGVEAQYGGLYVIKGESTELTPYDEDGYAIGQRVSVKRPKQLLLDERSATVGCLATDPREIPISRRANLARVPGIGVRHARDWQRRSAAAAHAVEHHLHL